MAYKDDKALYESNYERNEGDRYWTEQPAAAAMARRIPQGITTVWECAGGRGDLARVIKDFGFNVFASDIDVSEFDTDVCPVEQVNFLGDDLPSFFIEEEIDAIITNPPFGTDAEAFARKALEFENIRFVALLLRSEWKHSKRRLDLFSEKAHYAQEIALTWRPRWDWWFREKALKSPRHNFSWFVWDREHTGKATQDFATKAA